MPCDTPLPYRLATIDPKFNLTESQALKATTQAAAIWEQAYGKPLFTHSPANTPGQLTVAFSYDDRQRLRTELTDQENALDTAKTSLQNRIAAYDLKLAAFKERAAQLNKEIEAWNAKGGAPKDIYAELTRRAATMTAEAASLTKEAAKLNAETRSYGTSVETLNATVGTYNALLDTKPEEGLYNPADQSITIYVLGSTEELVSTVAHEFGHARGMDHLPNPSAIMYTYANSNIVPTPEDLAELAKVCQRQNRLAVLLRALYPRPQPGAVPIE
jgi:hypothetical protein